MALITGANRGLGHDLALALGAAGASVVAAARKPESLSDVVATIAADGGDALAVRLDVTDLESVEGAMAAAVERYGKLDILVNNAGLGTNHDAIDVTEQEWDELMEVNLKGLFFTSQAAARYMIPSGYGRIVNMASQAGVVGIRRHAAYSASKAAAAAGMAALAKEWRRKKIAVIDVRPPHTETGLATRPLAGTAPQMPEGLTPTGVAERIVAAIEAGEREVSGADFGNRDSGADRPA